MKTIYCVNEECISCLTCNSIAPEFFELENGNGKAFLLAQPESEEGASLCHEALEQCPVDAIECKQIH